MAFYKKTKQKINGKWYPKSVTVGKPVSTDEVSDRLAKISTVSRADVYAVLKELGGVLSDYMGNGRTVKLEGMGTFYYTANTSKNGVDTPEEVNAGQINGVRVRFIPETTRTSKNRVATRSLVADTIFWEEWGGTDSTSATQPEEPGTGGTTGDDAGL